MNCIQCGKPTTLRASLMCGNCEDEAMEESYLLSCAAAVKNQSSPIRTHKAMDFFSMNNIKNPERAAQIETAHEYATRKGKEADKTEQKMLWAILIAAAVIFAVIYKPLIRWFG